MEALHRPYYLYRAYKAYACLMVRRLLYRRTWIEGRENLPEPGQRYMVICNHQNSAADALMIVEALPNKLHPFIVARGDVFWLHVRHPALGGADTHG